MVQIHIINEANNEDIGDFSISFSMMKKLKKMANDKQVSFEELIRQILIKESKKIIEEDANESSISID